MPDYIGISNLGAMGIFLVGLALFLWKGLPAVGKWLGQYLDNQRVMALQLADLFRTEIQNERKFASSELVLQRELQAKTEERMTAALNLNTQAIAENTKATVALKEAVHEMVRKS